MPATDVVALLAITLDGYVARSDGSVDFLEAHPVEEFDFDAFTDDVDGLIMGRATYEQVAGFGWAWGARRTTVLTHRRDLDVPADTDIRFSAASTSDAIRALALECEKRLWVVGGGRVVTDGILGGAIDTLDLTVIPEAIGSGIPLFAAPLPGPLNLIESTRYSGGAIRAVYDLTGRSL
jgi:dihydrofolate reductase